MKKIKALNLGKLKNAVHFNFMHFVCTTITLYATALQQFEQVINAFKAAFDSENEAYLKADRVFLNSRLSQADNERDIKFRLVRDSIKMGQMFADSTKKEAADMLMKIIDLYGGVRITNLAMDAESGVLTNLVEDFEQRYSQQVQLLDLGASVQALKAANEAFLEIMRERTQYDAEVGKAVMVEARKRTDMTYRALVSDVNIQAYLGSEEELAPFIDYMNAEIDRYRIKTGQGTGNEESEEAEGEEGTEEEQPTAPTKYTISFVHNGQTVSSMELEAGAPVTAPAAPSGYHWVDVPATMPGQNVTVQSAQDSNEPPSLTR